MKKLIVLIIALVALLALAPAALAQDGPESATALVDLLFKQEAWFTILTAGIISHLVTNFINKVGFIPASLTEATQRYIKTTVGIVIPLLWTGAFTWLYNLAAVIDAQGYWQLGVAAIAVAYGTHVLSKDKVQAVSATLEAAVEELDERYIEELASRG